MYRARASSLTERMRTSNVEVQHETSGVSAGT